MQFITQPFLDLIEWVLSILPNSPFLILDTIDTTEFYQYIKWMNWFIPMSAIVQVITLWCSAILIYYVYQIVLRWVKAIQ